jgi:hypothetical protein
MKFKLFILAFGIAASGVAIADSYQSEISVGATRIDENGIKSKFDSYDLQGVYHFNAVNTANLPLAEAAYLGKSSNVFAGVMDFPRQDGSPSYQRYAVGAEFYIPEHFLYVRAGGYSDAFGSHHNNDWFTTVGLMPIDGLLVTTAYNHDEGYDANINAKYVTQIGGQFINVEAGVKDADRGTTFTIGGDYYVDNSFSVGGNIVDADYGNEYTLRTRKFFSESFSGELSYTDTPDGNIVNAGLAFRF